MVIFRPHMLGISVSEAMEKAKEFANVEEMKKYIVELWHNGCNEQEELFTADDIVIDENSSVNDVRIGWKDSMYVCVKRMGEKDYIKKYGVPQCIGMCATDYQI